MITTTRYKGTLALALALLCLGLFAPLAGAVEFKYTLEPRLSLMGDCSTAPGVDSIHDPDCAGEPPAYPPPPDRPAARFNKPFSVAVDDWGNLYVASYSGDGTEGRIDIFDPEGHFISELDDPHGPFSIAVDGEGNLYAYEVLSGVAEAPPPALVRYTPSLPYNPAAGAITYSPATRTTITTDINFLFNGLAIDRATASDSGDDRLYINEGERIRIYSSAKTGNTLLDTIEPAGMSLGKQAAVDAERRRLYVSTLKAGKSVVWVLKADAPYTLLKEINGSGTPAGSFFSGGGRLSIAVDETNGDFFIGDLAAQDDIYEFDASYAFVSTFAIPGGPMAASAVQSDVAENPKDPDPDDLNLEDNYRHLFVPLARPTGSAIAYKPPTIGPPEIKSATALNIGESEAELSALIHPHELLTTYEIEYVSEAQFAIDGFDSATLAEAGTIGALPSAQSVSALVSGLSPGTAYRFRISAENELGEAEKEATFTTHLEIEPPPLCPNDPVRLGASANLPDCRAYELATPPDTGGRPPSGATLEGEYFGMLQASPSGEAVNFLILSGALPGTEATGYFFGDPYLASRGESGWSTALAGPTGTQASKPKPGGFSPDQGYSFWMGDGEGSAVIGGMETTYLRYPDGHSELVGRGSLTDDPRAVGRLITEDGTHTIFQTFNFEANKAQKLEPEAPAEGIAAVYDRSRDPLTGTEETHVVSLLPGPDPTPTQNAFYAGASADGEGIAFEIGTTLYLRVANATTYEIASGVEFAGISAGGERIFYLQAGDLKAFDTTTEAVITFADTAEPVTPVNVAPEGERAYFVSESAIALSGPNPNGASPQASEPNLYLSEGAGMTPSFIATLTERDVEGIENEGTGAVLDGLGLWTMSLEKRQPALDPSRLTPEGSVLVFQSRADLDGYQPGEEGQVFRYDHAAGRLHCLSCPPTATAATGGATLQSAGLGPSPISTFAFVPALTPDGERVLFESTEALLAADTDGLRDVYEWEEEGVGSCKRAGGCVYLISSGRSAGPDYLFGHSQSGDDVFIHTTDVLIRGDEETASIYDARVGGGFASQEAVICVEEACRAGLTPPPPLPAPQSGPQGKSGNLKNCPRGKRLVKRKGKEICIKKKKKKHHKAAARKGAAR